MAYRARGSASGSWCVYGAARYLVEPPAAVGELVGGKKLRLVTGRAVEDVEERVLLELGEVAWLQARGVALVALRRLRWGRMHRAQLLA